MSLLQRRVHNYTGIHSSRPSPNYLSLLLSIDNASRRLSLGLIDSAFINFVASLVQSLLLVLLLPLGPLRLFLLGAEVVAEPLLDA